MRQKAVTPVALRKVPEIFCCTFAQRRSRSAWLLVKGMRRSSSKASTCSARAISASSRRRRWWWLSSIASQQNLEITSDPFVALDGGNSGQVKETPLVAGVMEVEQEVPHLYGPLLMLLLPDSCTISHQM